MKTYRTIAGLLPILFLTIFLVGTSYIFGQGSKFEHEKAVKLSEKRITIKMEKQPLGVVLRYLMENYEIPIGFEQSILDRGHIEYAFDTNLPASATHIQYKDGGNIKLTTTSTTAFKANLHPITLDVDNGDFKVVFDQIVSQMQNYKWEVSDGVINIFPMKGRDERFEKLLNLNIKNFTFEKGMTVEDITTNIVLLPEFRGFIKASNFHFSHFREGTDFVIKAQYGRTVGAGMDFSNLTFRQLLNRATRIKKGGWILKWRYVIQVSGKELIDIDI